MAFCITFGTHEFSSPLQGYEGVTAQCHNCGNWSGHCITRWPWFTVCFIPLIPLATHKYKEVACPICHFMQDLENRPDVKSQMGGGGGGGGGGMMGGPPPQQGRPGGHPPGWSGQPQPNQQPVQYK